MGNKYIYPTEKLNIQLNLEVDVSLLHDNVVQVVKSLR